MVFKTKEAVYSQSCLVEEDENILGLISVNIVLILCILLN